MKLDPGAVVGGTYRIVRLLGKGGMGAVYEATHATGRVALKVLHAHLVYFERSVTRFEREALAASKIGSNHIVKIFGLGELEDGSPYLVMEYYEGETMRDRLERTGPMQPSATAPLVLQLLDGLAVAHAAGIIHRDLKPDNVFLVERSGEPDLVKILDFGISKLLDPQVEGITTTGAVLGTPYFMAPEQARGLKEIDHRADIYSVGVMLYRAAAGRYPFTASSSAELLVSVLRDTPPPLASLAPVDRAFAAIVHRAMARDRDDRHRDARELSADLSEWLRSAPPPVASEGAPRTAPSATRPIAVVTPPPIAVVTPPPIAVVTPPPIAVVTPPPATSGRPGSRCRASVCSRTCGSTRPTATSHWCQRPRPLPSIMQHCPCSFGFNACTSMGTSARP